MRSKKFLTTPSLATKNLISPDSFFVFIIFVLSKSMRIHFHKYQVVLSTNQMAMDWISKGIAQEGDVFFADFQTEGKGTANNGWESAPKKNLILSLVLCPTHIEPGRQFLLTQLISLALLHVVQAEIPHAPVTIKWPNDLYVENKKIAGVLIQNIIQGNEIRFAIIGIGLNVNQKYFSSKAPNPVSIIHYKKEVSERESLLTKLIAELSRLYEQSMHHQQKLEKEYLQSLYRFGESSRFEAEGKSFIATIKGITAYGQLVVTVETGEERIYNFKEIRFVL